jgi:predicted NUDIX family NTP pyrophosphohydrolase
MARVSAGLLPYRWRDDQLEVFLVHPGGPFWASKDDSAWSIAKGEIGTDEAPLAAARREFEEETGIRASGPFISLGSVRQKAGKVVHAWAWEGDADAGAIVSNTAEIEWPPGSGRRVTYPEVDRCAWCDPESARRRINPAQAELIGRLEAALGESA